jgi:hypothetical protein
MCHIGREEFQKDFRVNCPPFLFSSSVKFCLVFPEEFHGMIPSSSH